MQRTRNAVPRLGAPMIAVRYGSARRCPPEAAGSQSGRRCRRPRLEVRQQARRLGPFVQSSRSTQLAHTSSSSRGSFQRRRTTHITDDDAAAGRGPAVNAAVVLTARTSGDAHDTSSGRRQCQVRSSVGEQCPNVHLVGESKARARAQKTGERNSCSTRGPFDGPGASARPSGASGEAQDRVVRESTHNAAAGERLATAGQREPARNDKRGAGVERGRTGRCAPGGRASERAMSLRLVASRRTGAFAAGRTDRGESTVVPRARSPPRSRGGGGGPRRWCPRDAPGYGRTPPLRANATGARCGQGRYGYPRARARATATGGATRPRRTPRRGGLKSARRRCRAPEEKRREGRPPQLPELRERRRDAEEERAAASPLGWSISLLSSREKGGGRQGPNPESGALRRLPSLSLPFSFRRPRRGTARRASSSPKSGEVEDRSFLHYALLASELRLTPLRFAHRRSAFECRSRSSFLAGLRCRGGEGGGGQRSLARSRAVRPPRVLSLMRRAARPSSEATAATAAESRSR
ncbi:hypothetical protein HPB49_017056 [Dermacentor silvarum]|uniref:Uncharacterized protein n=1 Tax=Dermacentor silvarum TaxID=543639 RepID=A0ACB8CGG9_DERSI|nr:hypothetical protein HPB49_017056 [Dermacentor silvarum]